MRDSHGLFDYESRSVSKKSFKTLSYGKMVRVNNDVEFVEPDKNEEEIGPDARALF